MKLRQAKKIIKRVGGFRKFAFFINHKGNTTFINKTQSETKACLYLLRHVYRWKRNFPVIYYQ